MSKLDVEFNPLPSTADAWCYAYSMLYWVSDAEARKRMAAGEPVPIATRQELLRLWRRRALELAQLGWTGLSMMYLPHCLECPPQFIKFKKSNNRPPCGRPTLCPHCWVRDNVFPRYSAMEATLFGSEKQQGPRKKRPRDLPSKSKGELLEFYYRGDYCNGPSASQVIGWESQELYETSQLLRWQLGLHLLVSVVPTVSEDVWLVHRRGLVFTHDCDTVIDLLHTRYNNGTVAAQGAKMLRLRRGEKGTLTRSLLAKMVGRACQYPLELLTAPAERVLEVLVARGGRPGTTARLSTSRGCFRRRSPGACELLADE